VSIFSRKKSIGEFGEISADLPIDSVETYWDNWEPGNKPLAEKMASPDWIPEALGYFTFAHPDLTGIDFSAVAKILSEGMAGGLPDSPIARRMVKELGLPRETADFLARCLTTYAQELDSLASYRGLVDEVEWLAGGCCEICDSNSDVRRKTGQPFPSGHLHPPACPECSCSLAPVVDLLK
jgi:hypothetical protein